MPWFIYATFITPPPFLPFRQALSAALSLFPLGQASCWTPELPRQGEDPNDHAPSPACSPPPPPLRPPAFSSPPLPLLPSSYKLILLLHHRQGAASAATNGHTKMVPPPIPPAVPTGSHHPPRHLVVDMRPMTSMAVTTSLLHLQHQEADVAPPRPRPCLSLPAGGVRRDEAQQVPMGQQEGGHRCVGMGSMMIIM
jgi:hypothetical protein